MQDPSAAGDTGLPPSSPIHIVGSQAVRSERREALRAFHAELARAEEAMAALVPDRIPRPPGGRKLGLAITAEPLALDRAASQVPATPWDRAISSFVPTVPWSAEDAAGASDHPA